MKYPASIYRLSRETSIEDAPWMLGRCVLDIRGAFVGHLGIYKVSTTHPFATERSRKHPLSIHDQSQAHLRNIREASRHPRRYPRGMQSASIRHYQRSQCLNSLHALESLLSLLNSNPSPFVNLLYTRAASSDASVQMAIGPIGRRMLATTSG